MCRDHCISSGGGNWSEAKLRALLPTVQRKSAVRIYKEVKRDGNEEVNLYNKYAYDYFGTREGRKK